MQSLALSFIGFLSVSDIRSRCVKDRTSRFSALLGDGQIDLMPSRGVAPRRGTPLTGHATAQQAQEIAKLYEERGFFWAVPSLCADEGEVASIEDLSKPTVTELPLTR